MLFTFDLLDIYYILVKIRFSPSLKDNIKVIDATINFLKKRKEHSNGFEMQYNKFLRDEINMISDIDKSIWHFGLLDSEYNISKSVNDIIIVESFLTIFESIKLLLLSKEYDEVFKISNYAHNFPVDLLFEYNRTKKNINRLANKLEKIISKHY